jgi:hypothetical protein
MTSNPCYPLAMEIATSRTISPPVGLPTTILNSIETAWIRIARRRVLSCVLIVALSLVVRLAILRVDPKPEPTIHDEFAYIFGAETLAGGRLATPPHPMWRFFETYYINMQPTYTTKEPPAQSAFLALGIRLFGHPWYGVLISVALMCGCICWMLQGWLPARYALLGGLFAIAVFGVSHYWIDSYWGGAVSAIGGALVFGALPRLARNGNVATGCVAAIGISILATSRPFEGLILVSLTFAGLLWWTRGHFAVWLRPPVVLPFGVILLITAGAMAYYNFKVTGSPTTLSYAVNEDRYMGAPIFWMMPPLAPKHREYRDPSMRAFWEDWNIANYQQVRHNPTVMVLALYRKIRELLGQGAGLTLMFLFACALPLAGIPRLRLTFIILFLFLCALTLNRYLEPHYMAPAIGAFFVAAMFGLRLLRCHRLGKQRTGSALVASVVALAGALFLFDSVVTIHGRGQGQDSTPFDFKRKVTAKLSSEPGMHLVLVHYAADHDFLNELVYNSPDIDAQKIVWAFDFGPQGDLPLLAYYPGRKVWLIQPDGPHPTMEPYSADQGSAKR